MTTTAMTATTPTPTPLSVMNAFIARAGRDGITHMKLQKLAYLAYGWWLAFKEEPLTGEAPAIWPYGPLFESAYHVLKAFGGRPIAHPQAAPFKSPEIADGEDARAFIDWIWARYGHRDDHALSDVAHRPGSPWALEAARHDFRVKVGTTIDLAVMKRHFRAEAAGIEGALGQSGKREIET